MTKNTEVAYPISDSEARTIIKHLFLAWLPTVRYRDDFESMKKEAEDIRINNLGNACTEILKHPQLGRVARKMMLEGIIPEVENKVR